MRATVGGVASRVVRARLDRESELALAVLKNETGRTESEAVRVALVEAAAKRRTKAALRAEAERLAADPKDVAEMRRIAAEFDEIRPEWPEW